MNETEREEEMEHVDQIVADIFKEISAAQEKHGTLPDDLIHCAAIISEETGELCQSTLRYEYEGRTTVSLIYAEACQVAAMAILLMLRLRYRYEVVTE